MKIMRRIIQILLLSAVVIFSVAPVWAAVRLKDIATIRDQRELQLMGYGLVVGLDGTGDGKNTQFTIRSVGNMMKRMGIEVPSTSIKVKNVAAVMVTATVSPYTKPGGSFDVTVSSMGDASSLEGGTLLMTPLTGVDGVVAAFAQGALSVGGTNRNFGNDAVVPNIQLVGRITDGGILEREIPTLDPAERSIMVTLSNPDFTTTNRVVDAINDTFGENTASAQDAGSVIVTIPNTYVEKNEAVRFIAEMERITFVPDEKARIVINERTGTIVAGANVSLSPVAIMHGTLALTIEEAPQPAPQQPQDLTQQQPAQPMPGEEPVGDRMVTFDEQANVGEVARALNVLGATPRDIIAIFQALKHSGSLRAELIII